MTKTKPMTDFNWGKKFTELQEKQGKLGTQKALISRSFIAHAIDQATSKAREEEHKICKRVYIDYVDWSEWGIDDEEASENFENEYQEESKSLKKDK